MDKLNAITLFCRVVETQSFTQAAQQAQISLAMASKLVAQLEDHLKVRLLQRTTRKITPTEAGLLYYQRCLPILSELDEADAFISDLTSSLQGKLTISVPLDFGLRFISPNIAKFIQEYPHLELNLEYSDRRVDVVAEGYDLVLRIGHLEDSSLVVKRVGYSQNIVLATPAYLKRFGQPKTLEDLAHHQCLLYESQIYWQFVNKGKTVKIKPKAKVLSNNGHTLLDMAKADLGIVNLPQFLLKDEIAQGELVPLLRDYTQASVDISLLYPHRRFLSPKVKAAISFFSQLISHCQKTH